MAARRKAVNPKRGEVYLVSFDPTVGAQIQKTRPALVLQFGTFLTSTVQLLLSLQLPPNSMKYFIQQKF